MQIKPNITKIICKRTYILSGVIVLEEFHSPNSSLSRSSGLCSNKPYVGTYVLPGTGPGARDREGQNRKDTNSDRTYILATNSA